MYELNTLQNALVMLSHEVAGCVHEVDELPFQMRLGFKKRVNQIENKVQGVLDAIQDLRE